MSFLTNEEINEIKSKISNNISNLGKKYKVKTRQGNKSQ